MWKNQVVMTIISVQNLLKKYHNKIFLREIAFSPYCMTEMWNFVAAFARNQKKIKSCVDKAFWDKTKSFLQYMGASVELKRAKTPVNQFFQSPTRRPLLTAAAAKLRPNGQNRYFSLHS
jgi:hypothetical protein